MIHIQIAEEFAARVPATLIEAAASVTLTHQVAPPGAEISIVITDNAQLQQLNSQFRGVDAPTDVLSFPADASDPDTGNPYLGDVLISCPKAAAQAAQGGHTLAAELQLLTVHGTLHLLGHDHAEPDEKARMWAAQEEILAQIGTSVPRSASFHA